MKRIARFELTSAPESFHEIYDVIDELVAVTGLRSRQKFRFAVCITEAFTNACIHGNRRDPGKMVTISFFREAGRLVAVIEDAGDGRTADIPQAIDLKQIKSDKFSGRGVAIMQEFADNFQVNERPDQGIEVRLEWNVTDLVPQLDVPDPR